MRLSIISLSRIVYLSTYELESANLLVVHSIFLVGDSIDYAAKHDQNSLVSEFITTESRV